MRKRGYGIINYYCEYILNNWYENNEWNKFIDYECINCFNNNIEI